MSIGRTKTLTWWSTNNNINTSFDRTFYNSKEYIDKFAQKNIQFTALRYYSLYLIIFRINNNTSFIIPVLSGVFPLSIKSIERDYPNFENCITEDPIDRYVVRDSVEKREIDIMVSNLFFISLNPKDPRYKEQMKRCIVDFNE